MCALELAEIKRKIDQCELEIKNTKQKIEKNLSDIKKKSPTIHQLLTNALEYQTTDIPFSTITHEIDGVMYDIIDSPNVSVDFLLEFLAKNEIYQKGHAKYGDSCLQIADATGRRLYYNDIWDSGLRKGKPFAERKVMDIEEYISGSTTYWNDNFFVIPSDKINDSEYINEIENEVMTFMYNEVKNNVPCVLQVNQVQSDGNVGRHYVTVIGLRRGLNPNSLEENDFSIIDPGDGEEKILGEKGDDKYARNIYANYGPIKYNGDSVYYYRVQTLIDENQRLEKLNAKRKKDGKKPLEKFPEEET